MTARIETRGQQNWHYRAGYQYRQRVAGPIEPVAQPTLWQRVKALAKG